MVAAPQAASLAPVFLLECSAGREGGLQRGGATWPLGQVPCVTPGTEARAHERRVCSLCWGLSRIPEEEGGGGFPSLRSGGVGYWAIALLRSLPTELWVRGDTVYN